jgi:hypothetical protein
VRAPGRRLGAALRAIANAVVDTLGPKVEQSLRATLARDRLLLWVGIGLWAASLVPLFVTPFLPFADLGVNTAAASLLWNAARGHGAAALYYKVNWAPVPYWTTYLLTAVVERAGGPMVAAKVCTAVISLMIPLGVMRLLLSFRRNPRLALWSFLLVYDHNMYAGWLSLMMGFALSFFVIAWTIEARTAREALRVVPFAALIGVTHIQAVWLLGIALPLLALAGRPIWRRLLVHGVSIGGTGILVAPWVLAKVLKVQAASASSYEFEWHGLDAKLGQFFGYTLDNFVQTRPVTLTALAFILLVVGPPCLGLLPRVATRERSAMPVFLVAAAGLLYLALPWAISGPVSHWYTYPRFATVILLALLAVPAPRLEGKWAAALLPGLMLTLAVDYETVLQFKAFGDRTRPFVEVIRHIKPEAAVLPLVLDDDDADPDLRLPPYHQIFAYAVAVRKGYEGNLWDQDSIPLLYRHENMKPSPGWDVPTQLAFTMEGYGKHYDYVLVQGFRHGDPLAPLVGGPLPRPRLAVEAGRWRLYEIERAP